jgi:peptidoglycan/LPS O-acetylase OafA/YrhL
MPDQVMQPSQMSPSVKQTRANNFSVLRILFATLVILSHSTELIDGNRSSETLTRLFGTISFGVLAVDGFFIVSGYLITKSYLSSEPISYLVKRTLRIYPGFIVAFVVSIFLCKYFVIAHPTPAKSSSVRLVDSTNRTVSRTDAPLAFAVLTTERKAA